MNARFEELDWQQTQLGEISLRRRHDPTLNAEVYEVKLGEEFLMSSFFTVAEVELARLGLAAVPGTGLDVVVGGLGLGYTAHAVLQDARVNSLIVVEALDAVIGWHRQALLPLAAEVTRDPRSRLVQGDFFALAGGDVGFDRGRPGRLFHAVLLDIDHTPRHVLHPSHAAFYTPEGLRRLADHLYPGGVFALWSNDPPDVAFGDALSEVFDSQLAHVVTFPNPLQGHEATNTVYVARRSRDL
ncbi:spermidine synthase [Kribbella soli]|uniref:Spermidine synthase n=1 Tax=Kribbella soli TaxID=1124743 RepID=A0A4R0HC68_9ACTN|nr:spermidine synthase [Kribbella soli]TCC07164.1 spermidine synthase [Kribbella soli]